MQSRQAADRDIAFVFQLFALYPHLTAYGNIAFPLRATNENRNVVDQRVREVAKALRIDGLLGKRPSALSGGDMQRVAIGRALVRRPKALLMDEPMGALDAKLREEMRAELKHIHIENEATTVYVTHDQVEAMAMADRIAIMNDGVLQQVGLPDDVYQHPVNLFVAQFVGSPIMNVADGAIRPGDGCTNVVLGEDDAVQRFPAELFHRVAEGRHGEDELAIGVRPEARAGGAPAHRRLFPGGGAHHRAARSLRYRRSQVRHAALSLTHRQRLREEGGGRGMGSPRRKADPLLRPPHR